MFVLERSNPQNVKPELRPKALVSTSGELKAMTNVPCTRKHAKSVKGHTLR